MSETSYEFTNMIAGYQCRPLLPTDVDHIQSLLIENALSDLEPIAKFEELTAYLTAQEKALPSISLGVLSPTGELVGFGLIRLNPQKTVAVLQGAVHIQHRNQGIGNAIFEWQQTIAESQLEGNSGRIIVETQDEMESKLTLLKKHGFIKMLSQFQMSCDLTQWSPPIIPETDLIFEQFHSQHEEAMRVVFNLSFSGHRVGEQDEEAFHARFINNSIFDPTHTILAFSKIENYLVGYYLSEHVEGKPNETWMEILAVDPKWQGRGYGRILLLNALEGYQKAGFESVSLDVDPDFSAAALSQYQKHGFKKTKGTLYFGKQL